MFSQYPDVTVEKNGLIKVTHLRYVGEALAMKMTNEPSCFEWSEGSPSFPVGFRVNPTNAQGLSEEFIINAFLGAAGAWNHAKANKVFDESFTIDYAAHYGSQNFTNEISFGEYPNPQVIAIAASWFDYDHLIESDIFFNTSFRFGDATVDPNPLSMMDLQSIATHEFGHAVGLEDVFVEACSDVTMYVYASYGDIEKRTLEKPDIRGLRLSYKHSRQR